MGCQKIVTINTQHYLANEDERLLDIITLNRVSLYFRFFKKFSEMEQA